MISDLVDNFPRTKKKSKMYSTKYSLLFICVILSLGKIICYRHCLFEKLISSSSLVYQCWIKWTTRTYFGIQSWRRYRWICWCLSSCIASSCCCVSTSIASTIHWQTSIIETIWKTCLTSTIWQTCIVTSSELIF